MRLRLSAVAATRLRRVPRAKSFVSMSAPSAIRSSRVVSVTFRQADVSKSSTSVLQRNNVDFGKAEQIRLFCFICYIRQFVILMLSVFPGKEEFR